jgi:hypothetical protein
VVLMHSDHDAEADTQADQDGEHGWGHLSVAGWTRRVRGLGRAVRGLA